MANYISMQNTKCSQHYMYNPWNYKLGFHKQPDFTDTNFTDSDPM